MWRSQCSSVSQAAGDEGMTNLPGRELCPLGNKVYLGGRFGIDARLTASLVAFV